MYKRDELKVLKKEFWEGFSSFLSLIPELFHRKGRFLLYDTKISGVEMKFDLSRNGVMVVLELNHSNLEKRELVWKKIKSYRVVFEEQQFSKNLIWNEDYVRDCGSHVKRVYVQCEDLNFHRREDWAKMYRFMAEEMLKMETAFLEIRDVIAD